MPDQNSNSTAVVLRDVLNKTQIKGRKLSQSPCAGISQIGWRTGKRNVGKSGQMQSTTNKYDPNGLESRKCKIQHIASIQTNWNQGSKRYSNLSKICDSSRAPPVDPAPKCEIQQIASIQTNRNKSESRKQAILESVKNFRFKSGPAFGSCAESIF